MNFRSKNGLAYAVRGLVCCLGLLSLQGCIFGGFCGAAPAQTEITVYPTSSSTGAPVPSVVFSEQGSPLDATCSEPSSSDPNACTAELLVLEPGTHVITVSAPGYMAQTLTVDTTVSDAVHLAVQLTATP